MARKSESHGPDHEMKNAKTCYEEIELLVILVMVFALFGIVCFLFCIATLISVKNQRRYCLNDGGGGVRPNLI